MKLQILDNFYDENILNQLKKDEEIIWKGKPYYEKYIKLWGWDDSIFSWVIKLGFILFVFTGFRKSIISVLIILLFTLLVIVPDIIKFIKRKKTEYLITNHRIIFKLWENGKEKYHSIHMNDIKSIYINNYEDDNLGVIFLVPKNLNPISFNTYDLKNGDKRHLPTLESIKNIVEINNMIKENIKKIKSSNNYRKTNPI